MADNFWASQAKTKLYTSFESVNVWYECLSSSRACLNFHLEMALLLHKTLNSTCKPSNGDHCKSQKSMCLANFCDYYINEIMCVFTLLISSEKACAFFSVMQDEASLCRCMQILKVLCLEFLKVRIKQPFKTESLFIPV